MSNLMQLENISFSYAPGPRHVPVLNDISGTITAGKTLAICGPNGSGKSTLARLMAGLLKPQQGRVHIQEQPLQHISRRQLAQQVALVTPIAAADIHNTVEELVAMGRYPYLKPFEMMRASDLEIIDKTLDATGLTAQRQTPFQQLSSGAQQLVLLARAFAQQTPLLILDEPTAHLDVAHVRNLLRCLQELQQHPSLNRLQATVIITHDLNLVSRYCDQLWLMKNGRKVADGPTATTLNEANLSSVFDCQLTVIRPSSTAPAYLSFDL